MAENPFDYQLVSKKNNSPIVDLIQAIVIALALVVVIYLFFIVPGQVDGQSMVPNFDNRDLVLGNKLVQLLGNTEIGQNFDYDYKRGDVVIFDTPNQSQPVIKRIIAAENDSIQIIDNKVIVNGMLIDEHYIPKSPNFRTDLPEESLAFIQEGEIKTIPQGKYFLLGDNRTESIDSRFKSVGFVDRSSIRGRVFLRFWPLQSFGTIQRGTYDEIPYSGDVL